MTLLVCDCGGHEFVVFHCTWVPAKNGLQSPLYGACVSCGKTWGLENALWIDEGETA